MISKRRRDEIVDALRRGTVPQRGLGELAVGLDRFTKAIDEELSSVERGSAVFKAVRGEYGSGKTFFARWLQETALRRGWACSEVQISEGETPLHRIETVYRRLTERMATEQSPSGALRAVVDAWFFALEEDILAGGKVDEDDTAGLLQATNDLMEGRLRQVSDAAPAFAAALRGYRKALAEGDGDTADGLLAWIGGQPNVGAAIKRAAGIKGQVDHFGALSFLQGLLLILKDSGHKGLLLVLDEVETLQRVRSDVRDRALNALRQLVDEVDGGRFPGLYLVITGTAGFFEGPQGIKRLAPLAQRLHTDFQTEARFDNPRAVQIRLPGFDLQGLQEVGRKVRDIYGQHAQAPERISALVDDEYVALLAQAVTGELGGKVGIAPRVFLKKLVGDVLDRVDQFDDFAPRQHYALTLGEDELSLVERNARAAIDPDDVELDL